MSAFAEFSCESGRLTKSESESEDYLAISMAFRLNHCSRLNGHLDVIRLSVLKTF